jgi:hypothetical protein
MRIFPAGPCCFKQPTLSEVLSNTAPAPYTLSAFMAYLSQNHCLETLEFTMDAGRYRKHYNSATKTHNPPSTKDCAYVRKLWQKLLDAYVVPNAPREVNLPCSIRDQLLSTSNSRAPPPPEALDSAVNLVHELMQESVLVPFLSECQSANVYQPPTPASSTYVPTPTSSSFGHHHGSDENIWLHGSLDERFLRRHKRDPSPPHINTDFISHSYSGPRMPRSASPFSGAPLGWGNRHSQQQQQQQQPTTGSWASGCSGDGMGMGMGLMDDSGSRSPTSWATPVTPPTTPPTSEALLHRGELGSPRRNTGMGEKAEKGWKKMTGGIGRGLGWGRRRGGDGGGFW